MGSWLRYHHPLQAVAAFPPPRISIDGNTGTIIVKEDLGDVRLGRCTQGPQVREFFDIRKFYV